MGDSDLVRFGASGSVSIADTSATLPTDEIEALDAAFEDLGLISEDGATIGQSITKKMLKAWGIGNVRTSITDSEVKVSFKCLETNARVLELWTGSANTGLSPKVKYSGKSQPNVIRKAVSLDWAETIESETFNFRLVLPRGELDSVADVTVNSNDPSEYEFTFIGTADDTGHSWYLYTNETDIGGS